MPERLNVLNHTHLGLSKNISIKYFKIHKNKCTQTIPNDHCDKRPYHLNFPVYTKGKNH